jgi:superfamily II DNA/RNA helicase
MSLCRLRLVVGKLLPTCKRELTFYYLCTIMINIVNVYRLPLIDVIDPSSKKVQAVILAPSRELVSQIAQVGEQLFKDTGVNIISIIGGANVRGQVTRLREDRPQVIVATPGRLAELVFGLKKLKLGNVRALIIDEVDNLLQDPFLGELEMLWQALPLLNRGAMSSSSSSQLDALPQDTDNGDLSVPEDFVDVIGD